MTPTLPMIASLWIGDAFTAIERASAQSFLDQGHHVVLYRYDPVANVPADVEQRDAREVFDAGRIIRHRKTNSPALHSDMFRYALMQKTDAIWVDLDMIALRPFVFPGDYVIGFEAPGALNGAVMRLPKGSPALARACVYGPDHVGYPPHIHGARLLKYRLKTLGRGMSVDRWTWGSIGPRLLTELMTQTGEIAHAMPVDAFYPVPMAQVEQLCTPGALTPDGFGPDTYGVHLWAQKLRNLLQDRFDGTVPEGSFLHHFIEASRT